MPVHEQAGFMSIHFVSRRHASLPQLTSGDLIACRVSSDT